MQTPYVRPQNPFQRGEHVRAKQQLLALRGFSPGTIDGVYGGKSQVACKRFQAARGLEADAIIGDRTLARLLNG
jgi:peptidoglycan hydrolase-like protein with peptidoglycan-binding domain